MKKIYFAPTYWANTQTIFDDYKFQTPNNDGVWENIQGTCNLDEADYVLIQDNTPIVGQLSRFRPGNLIYISREALDPNSIHSYPPDRYNHFSCRDNTGYLTTRWMFRQQGYGGTTKTYTELKNYESIEKTKEICCILSNTEACEGHTLRKRFVQSFMSKYKLDLFGSVSFANSTMLNNDKFNTLKDYKYCLGFDNQDNIDHFFGTQFTDTILAECVPIFWCGTDLSKHFHTKSFIQFNARDNNEIDRIIDIIKNDNYEERLPWVKEAKDLLLDKYNLWPTLKKIIDKNENSTI